MGARSDSSKERPRTGPGLDRGSGLATAVRQALTDDIATGRRRPGTRLPPEPDLAAELGVSRPTLREALRSLEEDGFVSRVRGSGTYVTYRPRLKNNLDVNFGVTEAILMSGMQPGTEDARVYRAPASAEEGRRLAVEGDADVVVVERVRTADGRPVVFSRDILPAWALGDRMDLDEELGRGSLYRFLQTSLGLVVRQGVATLRPARADRLVASRLRVKGGALLLYLQQVDYEESGRPVLFSHEFHLADAIEFSVVRRGPGRLAADPF